MPTLEQEYAIWKDERERGAREVREKQLEADYRAHQADKAQGGSIRQGTPSVNLPVGATVGGIAGAGLGLAVTGGNPVGALVGGAAGTALGEVAQQGYELLKDPSAAPKSLGESVARVGEQEAYQLVGEGIGRLGGSLIAGRRLAPGLPASITPQEQQAMQFLTQRGYTQGYMPSEVTESRGLDILHNIAEYSLFGGGAIKKFREKRDREVYHDLATQMIADLGPKMSADDVGRAVVHSVNHKLEMEKIPIAMEYNTIESLAAPGYTHVPTRMSVERTDVPIERDVIARMTVNADKTPITENSIKTMKVKETNQPAKSTDKLVGYDDAGDAVYERVETDGKLLRLKIKTTRQDVQRGERLEGLNVKTEYQTLQVGEQLQRLKVMTATQELQISGARIDLSPLKEELSGALRTAKEAGGLENKAMGTTMLSFLAEKPDMVSYPVAKQIRTELRTMREGLANNPETKNAPAIGLADKAYASMTKRIHAGLQEFDPSLAARWEDVNFRESARQGQFNNDLVRALVKDADTPGSGKPEAIVDQVFQHNNVTTINNLKNAVDPPTWDKMLSWHWRDAYAKAEGSGEALKEAFFGAKSGLGEKEMVQAYGPERVNLYKQMINAMEVGQTKATDKTGTIFIQLKQPGALMQMGGASLAALGLVQDDVDVASTMLGSALILSPPILARLMTNPTSAKWILQGMKIPAGTKEATALAARILPLAFPRLATQTATEPPPQSKTGLPPTTQRPMGDKQ